MMNSSALFVALLLPGILFPQKTETLLTPGVPAMTASSVAAGSESTTASAGYGLIWEKPFDVAHEPTLIVNDALFALSVQGNVIALRLNSGEEKWKVSLLPYFSENTQGKSTDGRVMSNLVFAATPIAVGKLILVALSIHSQGKVFAMDADTGEIKWSYTSFAEFGISRGAVQSGLVANQEVVIFRTGKGITCINLADGSEKWNQSLKDQTTSFSGSNHVLLMDDTSVYLGADQGVARSFRLADGKLNWECPTSGVEIHEGLGFKRVNVIGNIHTPLLYKDTLLTADGVGNVYAISKQDGKVLWKTNVGVTWQFCASKTNSIYAATEKGLVELDASTGAVKQYRLIPGGCFTCTPWQDSIAITGNFRNGGGWSLLKQGSDFSTWDGVFQQSDFGVTDGANYGKDRSGNDYVVLVGLKKKPKQESAFENLVTRIRFYQAK